MRYLMRQKFFSFGDDFMIRDAEENPVYNVDGHVFTLAKRLEFKDLDGRQLAIIRQKLLAWKTTYDVFRNEAHGARLVKNWFGWLHPVEAGLGDAAEEFRRDDGTWVSSMDFEVPADLQRGQYALVHIVETPYAKVTRDGEEVANVSKQFVSLRDSYGIDIADGEDDVLILCVAVIIDLIAHSDRSGVADVGGD